MYDDKLLLHAKRCVIHERGIIFDLWWVLCGSTGLLWVEVSLGSGRLSCSLGFKG